MTEQDVAQRLSALQATRDRLQTTVAQKKADLGVFRRDFESLLTRAKQEFGTNTPEELTAKADELTTDLHSTTERLQSAVALFEQGNFTAAARVLELQEPVRETHSPSRRSSNSP